MTMANVYTNPFIHNIGLNEKNSLSHLLDHISPEIDNETTLIEHSKYYNDVEFNPGTPYGTYMSHVFFLHWLHEYNKKNYFKLSPILL